MITIIGAGMAGLLAGHLLRRHNPLIVEAQPTLPNNHSAVLRFRSPEIGDLIGIPFKKVKMIKASVPWLNPVADALAYSRKTTGTARSDRSITSSSHETHDRWIAPPDFIQRMAKGLDISYGVEHDFSFFKKVLSTIPLPVLAKKLKYDRPLSCESVVGFNVRANVTGVDAYVSLYIPSPYHNFNRVSITGDELIVEFSLPGSTEEEARIWASDEEHSMKSARTALSLLGLDDVEPHDIVSKVQRYSKILPMNDEHRRTFIHWASSVTGKAWQLGRYATWRPGLLMDDLVQDLRVIDRWILDGAAAPYEMEKFERMKK